MDKKENKMGGVVEVQRRLKWTKIFFIKIILSLSDYGVQDPGM